MRVLISSATHIGPAAMRGPMPHTNAAPSTALCATPAPRPAPLAPKLQLHAAPAPRRRTQLLRAQQGDAAGVPEEELESEDDWSEEEGLSVDEFDDVTITGLGEEDASIQWADYLATNVVGSSVVEILEEERVAGVELDVSPAAAAAAAAVAAAAADAASSGIVEPNAAAASTTDAATAPAFDAPGVAVSATRFFERDTLSLLPEADDLGEWDLRAAMEKRRRMERERDAWQAEQARFVGRYRPVASDWRTDVRIKDTGDPTAPDYREWTLREIWDLIVLGGQSADPRDLPFTVESPDARTDFVAQGFYQHPEVPEFLAATGRLIKEEDEADIVDGEAEAMLSAEFENFDDAGWGAAESVDFTSEF